MRANHAVIDPIFVKYISLAHMENLTAFLFVCFLFFFEVRAARPSSTMFPLEGCAE
jgi:hypothetical protein